MAILGLFSGKENHPLADAGEARQALAPLASASPLAAVEDVAAWLEPLPTVDGLKLERRAEIVLLLDESGAAHARRLAREYLTALQSARSRETMLWQAGHNYWHKLALAYEDCLARLAARPKSLDADRHARLCAHLLHAYGARLKWRQFRYGPVDASLWAQAGQVYRHADEGGFAADPLRLDAHAAESTSVEQEYLKLLVFHAASMDKLLPLEIELAERLIAGFLPHFELTRQVRPENVYWVDAALDQPPTRLVKLPQASPTLRFFGTAPALSEAENLKARIERIQAVPPELPLGGQYPVDTVLAVLDHLARCWAPKPPMRTSARHPDQSLIAVIHGMEEIHARLSGAAGNQPGETWIAENVSLGGMAARMPLSGNDWMQVGALIGMRPERGDKWLVGVIRRFARESESRGVAGIETLGKAARAVEILCSGISSQAILPDFPLRPGQMTSLALPERAWEDFLPATLKLDGASWRLLPFGVGYRGAGFLVGRYRVEAA